MSDDLDLREVEIKEGGRVRHLIGMPVEKAIAWALRLVLTGTVLYASFLVGGLRQDIRALTEQLTALKVEFAGATTVLQEQSRNLVRVEVRVSAAEVRLDGHDRRIERLEDRGGGGR